MLSIVTITYKDPQGLAKTLESLHALLKEKSLYWEHIIVDSSPDLNAAVLEKYKKNNWPLRHILTGADGIYPAFNSGLGAVKGNSVWFLNSGDLLHSTTALLSALGALKTKPEIDFCALPVNLTRNSEYLYKQSPPNSFFEGICGKNAFCHQSLIFRTKIFHAHGFYSLEYKLASDYEHLFRAYIAKAKYLPIFDVDCLVDYDMSGQSSNYQSVLQEFRKIQLAYKDELSKKEQLKQNLEWHLYSKKLLLIKNIGKSSMMKSALQPFWVFWKRS